MKRLLYRWLVRMHPSTFRDRYEPELLVIFDGEYSRATSSWLLGDALLSLGRQWLLRGRLWPMLVASIIAQMQWMFIAAMWHLPSCSAHAAPLPHTALRGSNSLMPVVLIGAIALVVLVSIAALRANSMMKAASRKTDSTRTSRRRFASRPLNHTRFDERCVP